MSKLTAIIFVCVIACNAVSALECYGCINCKEPVEFLKQPCSNEQVKCGTFTLKHESTGVSMVNRGCVEDDTCKPFTAGAGFVVDNCKTCNSDLCNTGGGVAGLSASMGLLLSALMVLVYASKR